MNLATIVISIFLVVLFGLAIRHLVKKGTCAGCSGSSPCHSGCSGNTGSDCSTCSHCKSEPTRLTR
jgi:hypothetical protein